LTNQINLFLKASSLYSNDFAVGFLDLLPQFFWI